MAILGTVKFRMLLIKGLFHLKDTDIQHVLQIDSSFKSATTLSENARVEVVII